MVWAARPYGPGGALFRPFGPTIRVAARALTNRKRDAGAPLGKKRGPGFKPGLGGRFLFIVP